MNEIVPYSEFRWFLTALTFGLASVWFVYDAFNLIRSRTADRSDPIVRDKQFGYVIGLAIGAIGMIGVLRFHGVL